MIAARGNCCNQICSIGLHMIAAIDPVQVSLAL